MTLLIDNRTDFVLTEEMEGLLQKVVKQSLRYEKFEEECEVSLSFVTKEEIQKLNYQYRGKNTVTDVLSFPLLTFEEGEIADENEKGEIVLGDIIISVERAKEQAKEYGHSLKREILFLTVHSMLHLLGYDHMEKEEEEEMFLKQKEILSLCNVPREIL